MQLLAKGTHSTVVLRSALLLKEEMGDMGDLYDAYSLTKTSTVNLP